MKSRFQFLVALLAVAVCGYSAPASAGGDSLQVIDKSFVGKKSSPGSTKLGAIFVKVQIEALLKSRETASIRAGVTMGDKQEFVTLFTRSIKEGRTALEIPMTVNDFKGKTLVVVVWIDENPAEAKSPLKPIVFEKFGFDLSSI